MGLLQRIADAFGAGVQGGITNNWNDEWARNAGNEEYVDHVRRMHDESPVAYAAGELVGAAPWAGAGGTLAHALAKSSSPRTRLLIALLFGAGHGALAGSGGFKPGENMTLEDRVASAGLGAALGGAIGAGGVGATRAVRDVGRNLPAIAGIERLAEGGTRQVMPFTGTRVGAPLTLSLAGEGTAAERARAAIQSALAQDEAGMVRETGQGVLGRFANDGRNLRAFGSDNLPQSTAALRALGAQSPGGSARVEGMAQDLIEQQVRRDMRAMRAPKPEGLVTRARIAKQEAEDFVRTFDDPTYHKSWMQQMKRLSDGEKAGLAARMVRELRRRAKDATGSEAEAFQRFLRDPIVSGKLKALGVNMNNLRGARKASRAIEGEVERLRKLAQRPQEPNYNFRNWDDRDLANQGTLNEADAIALLEAMMQPQRAFAVRPDSAARILSGQYERGVRFSPQNWVNTADPEDVMGSLIYAQPVAAGLPTLGYAAFGGRE